MNQNGHREVKPRLLHRRSEVGYTTNKSLAMPKEPEAVDEETQLWITREARRKNEHRKLAAERHKLLALRGEIDKRIDFIERELGIEAEAA